MTIIIKGKTQTNVNTGLYYYDACNSSTLPTATSPISVTSGLVYDSTNICRTSVSIPPASSASVYSINLGTFANLPINGAIFCLIEMRTLPGFIFNVNNQAAIILSHGDNIAQNAMQSDGNFVGYNLSPNTSVIYSEGTGQITSNKNYRIGYGMSKNGSLFNYSINAEFFNPDTLTTTNLVNIRNYFLASSPSPLSVTGANNTPILINIDIVGSLIGLKSVRVFTV